jgi:hypothetical protein
LVSTQLVQRRAQLLQYLPLAQLRTGLSLPVCPDFWDSGAPITHVRRVSIPSKGNHVLLSTGMR